MTTRRPTAHAVGLLHAEPTMEDGVESLGADLNVLNRVQSSSRRLIEG